MTPALATTPRAHFVNSREVVLVKRDHANGPYFEETMNVPKTYGFLRDAWLDHDCDEALAFYLLDTETMSATDITDDFAACYLRERTPHPDDFDTLPLYVRNATDIWEDYAEEWHCNQSWFADARRQGVA